MIRNYFKIAWRNTRNNRTYTLISLSSLVSAITLFFFIILWVKKELSYDKSFPDRSRICRVETSIEMKGGSNNSLPTVGWPVGKFLSADYPEIEKLTYLRNWSPIIYQRGEHFYENALYADNSFLNLFQYKLSEGNVGDALEKPYSIVISKKLKEKYFGNDEPAIGKRIMISDTVPYMVTGVFADLHEPSHLKFDMVGSLNTYFAQNPEGTKQEFESGWFDVNMYNYVKLKKTASVEALDLKIKDLVLEKGKEAVERTGFKSVLNLRPLSEIYLQSRMSTASGNTGSETDVKLFFIIALFILFIACLNFINLTTAKSVERAKEIGIRKVLGSNRKKLIFQFMSETAFLCITAAAISICLMIILLPLFNDITDESFSKSELFSNSNSLLLVSIIAILIPIAGFYPSWVLSSFRPVSVLKGLFSHSSSGAMLRKGLVVTQFAISVFFITSTIIVWQQMKFMKSTELGFDKEKVLIMNAGKVPWTLRHQNAEFLKNTLSGKPGIENITACTAIPGRDGWKSQFAWAEDNPKESQFIVEYIPVDANYVKTLGLQLKAGRDFIAGNVIDSTKSLIINEAAVRLFGWHDAASAIGKQLATSGKEGHVIGVLKDYHQHGLQEKINPIVLGFAPYVDLFALRYNTITSKQAVETAMAAWKQSYTGYPFEYRFMDEDFQRQYDNEEKFQNLVELAAILSIFIACLGLFGLSLYTAQKRIKEIGIRKILGASVPKIATLLSKDFMKLVLISILLASPVAWWLMNNWLKDFAYRISVNPWVFVLAGITAIFIALLTVSFQAIKVAIANPVKSLRTE